MEAHRDPRAAATPLLRLPLELTDEAVIARVRDGEIALFEVLMRRYNQRVFRAARAVLHDDGEAEEAAQDAWIAAFTHLASFAARARFSTWLTRIALNEAIGRTRLRSRAAELRNELTRDPSPATETPEQTLLDGEVRRALEVAIDHLPRRYRATFVLRELEGLSTAEAAECLEIAEETVKTRLHRARALLRRDLGERFGGREAFAFAGARCDRIVASVLARIGVAGGSASRRGDRS